jgi:hypothetical protein
MQLNKLSTVIILVSFAGILFSATMPSPIAYHGILTNNAGVPVKDSSGYNLTFSLFDDSSASNTPLWSANHKIQTKNGVFSVMLGSINTTGNFDSLKFDKQYWLSVKRDDGAQFGPGIKLSVVPYAKRALVADSAGKIDGNNITNASIDSTKIIDNTITTNTIKNGTILTQDADTSFKAPKAGIADTAKWILSSAITPNMISSAQIASLDGSKITNPDFGSQKIVTSETVTGRVFLTRTLTGNIASGRIDTLKVEHLETGSCYVANFYMTADQIDISKSAIIQTLNPGAVAQVNQIGNLDYNLGNVVFTTFEGRPAGSYGADPWGRGKNSFWIIIDSNDFGVPSANWWLTLTKIGGI